jgi:hypothetical protein
MYDVARWCILMSIWVYLPEESTLSQCKMVTMPPTSHLVNTCFCRGSDLNDSQACPGSCWPR